MGSHQSHLSLAFRLQQLLQGHRVTSWQSHHDTGWGLEPARGTSRVDWEWFDGGANILRSWPGLNPVEFTPVKMLMQIKGVQLGISQPQGKELQAQRMEQSLHKH